jgi:hypothetical protein
VISNGVIMVTPDARPRSASSRAWWGVLVFPGRPTPISVDARRGAGE